MSDVVQDYTKNAIPPYFGCPMYIHNTKKASFVRLRGCPYVPLHLDAPVHKQHKESIDISGFSNNRTTFILNYWQAFAAKHDNFFWSVWENVLPSNVMKINCSL